MSNSIHRAYPRVPFETPIQWAVAYDKDHTLYHCARLLNYSSGGFCYETKDPLDPEAEVTIVMNDYTPDESGPESYRSYLTRVCWIQPLSKRRKGGFTTGAQIIARSHENLIEVIDEPMVICDLCGALMPVGRMKCTDGNAQLCDQCFKHFHSIPAGTARLRLERYLVGNIV